MTLNELTRQEFSDFVLAFVKRNISKFELFYGSIFDILMVDFNLKSLKLICFMMSTINLKFLKL